MAYNAAVEQSASMDTQTSTVSESDSMLVKQPAARSSARRVVPLFGLAVVLGVATVAALASAGMGAAEVDGDAAVSQAAVTEATVIRMGCANWDSINLMEPKVFDTTNETAAREKCKSLCDVTMGCNSYNFQPYDCSDGLGLKAGACYIFGEGCQQKKNVCWDLHIRSASVPGWEVDKARTGCSNWESILIDGNKSIVTDSPDQCGALCSRAKGCKSFNYQAGGCSGSEGNRQGSCYLFNGDCTYAANSCYDVYKMVAQESVTTVTSLKTNNANHTAVASALLASWAKVLEVDKKELTLSNPYVDAPDTNGMISYSWTLTYTPSSSRRLAQSEGRRLFWDALSEVMAKMAQIAQDASSLDAAIKEAVEMVGAIVEGVTATTPELKTEAEVKTVIESKVVESLEGKTVRADGAMSGGIVQPGDEGVIQKVVQTGEEANKTSELKILWKTGENANKNNETLTVTPTDYSKIQIVEDETEKPDPPKCSKYDDCSNTKCCVDEGHTCYRKNEWHAGCRPTGTCEEGQNYTYDPPEHKSPWSCEDLGSEPTEAPAACVESGTDCRESKCCSQEGYTCYEKNQWWASCQQECVPDSTQSYDPTSGETWTCKVLGDALATTTAAPQTTSAPE